MTYSRFFLLVRADGQFFKYDDGVEQRWVENVNHARWFLSPAEAQHIADRFGGTVKPLDDVTSLATA